MPFPNSKLFPSKSTDAKIIANISNTIFNHPMTPTPTDNLTESSTTDDEITKKTCGVRFGGTAADPFDYLKSHNSYH